MLARSMRMPSVSSERPSIQHECGSSCVPIAAAQRLDRLGDVAFAAERRAGDQVGMAADVFGQRIDRDVGAVVERTLEHRAEQRVVAHDDRAHGPGWRAISSAMRRDSRDVDQRVGRVRRRLDHDDRDAALACACSSAAARMAASSTPSAKPTAPMPKCAERAGEQRLGAAVERLRMQDARRPDGRRRGWSWRSPTCRTRTGCRPRRPRRSPGGPRRSRCWDG